MSPAKPRSKPKSKSDAPKRELKTAKLLAALPLVLAVLAVLAVSWNFLSSGWHHSVQSEWDWDFYFASREAARRIWMAGGTLFPWVPYMCGGFPLYDSTEMPYLSPFLPLWQLIGPVPGAKWEYVILLIVGMLGMHQAGKALVPNGSRWIWAMGGLQFVLSGFFVLHLNAGHISFAPFALFPWIAYGYLTRRVEPIALALAAGPVLAANNYFMHAILFALAAGIARPRTWLPLTVKAGLWAGVLGAPLLAHTFSEIRQAKYLNFSVANHHEYPQSVGSLFELLTVDRRDFWSCDVDCFWEYGNYLGLIAVILGLAGLARGVWVNREMRPWGWVALVFFLIALGPFASFAPFSLFIHFPLLSRLEVNTRFLLAFSVPLILGWQWFLGAEVWPRRRALAIGLAVLSVAPALFYAKYFFDFPGRGRELPDLRTRSADVKMLRTIHDFRVGRYDAIASESGLAVCHVSSSKKEYPGKVRVNEPGMLLQSPSGSQARFDDRYWWVEWNATPEQLSEGKPLRWVLNQNHSPHQRVYLESQEGVSTGVTSDNELLAWEIADPSKLTPGLHRFKIALEAPLVLKLAYVVFVLGWIGFFAQWAMRTRQTTRKGEPRDPIKRGRANSSQ